MKTLFKATMQHRRRLEYHVEQATLTKRTKIRANRVAKLLGGAVLATASLVLNYRGIIVVASVMRVSDREYYRVTAFVLSS